MLKYLTISYVFFISDFFTMVCVYKRKIETRKYKEYTGEDIYNSLSKVSDGGWSLRNAVRVYNIVYNFFLSDL